MLISIANPIQATWIFTAVLVISFCLLIRRRKTSELFPLATTQELKGLAILAIVFSHIGYFLATDQRFLFPLSILAGVGVNLFLFLSGYGLTISVSKKQPSTIQFYRANLVKLFTPFWLSLFLFFSLDFIVLKIIYPWSFIWHSIIGFFPTADLYHDLNSPLWYFTLIFGYYLLFPLVFSKKYPWFSAIILYFAGWGLIKLNPAWLFHVKGLYETHFIAFPLGVLIAWLFAQGIFFSRLSSTKIISALAKIINKVWLKKIGYYILVIALLIVIGYTAYYSGVGQKPSIEQNISLLTMSAIIILFLIKKIDFKLFYWFGLYSYEIYLLHWPILYRYDFLYKYLPAWLATAIYLVFFLGLAIGLNKIVKLIIQRILPPSSASLAKTK